MMNLSFGELLLIFGIALIIFGPDKLPEIGKSLGRLVHSFKAASAELQGELRSSLNVDSDADEPTTDPTAPLTAPLPPPPPPVLSASEQKEAPAAEAPTATKGDLT